jgi:transposase InsO family protein
MLEGMSVGLSPRQADMFVTTTSFCEGRVPADSIYGLLHRECLGLFPDEMFADVFCDVGRRSVPPMIVAVVMVLQRIEGCSDREAVDRFTYEWTEAGALLHIDAFELAKFKRPGHWAHGDRSERHRTRHAGKVKVIGVIDDHTRLVYCELHTAENAEAVSATLRRAAAWMLEQGCGPVQAVMSDNAKCYATSHAFRATLAELNARHILIPPYTPRWNGKIERFFGTLDTEWARSRIWPNSARRDRALSSFIRYYNRRRPHSACGGRPPITRVQHVCGQDS